jgi:hypothetical protein
MILGASAGFAISPRARSLGRLRSAASRPPP